MKHTNSNNFPSGLWVAAAILAAILCTATLLYVGWFNSRTHVDSMNGDNVTENYPLTKAQAESPAQTQWQNTAHNSLDQLITNPTDTLPAAGFQN